MRTVVDRAVESFIALTVEELPEFLERTNLTYNNVNQYAEAIKAFEKQRNDKEIVSLQEAKEIIGVSYSTVRMYVDKGRLTNISPKRTHPRFRKSEVLSLVKGKRREISQTVPSGDKKKPTSRQAKY